jgi:hypothetical protein
VEHGILVNAILEAMGAEVHEGVARGEALVERSLIVRPVHEDFVGAADEFVAEASRFRFGQMITAVIR